ncbi:MAG: DoxX family protein [Candidatus Altiarchaeota archaeon]|nr:DoxX family protein [Candidatus Altiarchaeota archaeon]
MISELNEKFGAYYYLAFRVIVGLLFLGHGLMKFGFFGGNVTATLSVFWWAGVIEIVVGLAIALGLFVRLASVLGVLEMLYAYITVHAPQGLFPFENGGELALLYVAVFLVTKLHGAGEYSLEKTLMGQEKF